MKGCRVLAHLVLMLRLNAWTTKEKLHRRERISRLFKFDLIGIYSILFDIRRWLLLIEGFE